MKDNITELKIYDRENDPEELQRKKDELETKIKWEEERAVYLSQEAMKLEQRLNNLKSRYKKEQIIKNKNKRQLEKLGGSRSWKLSAPVRTAGGVLKKIRKKGNRNSSEINSVYVEEDASTDFTPADEWKNARSLERKLWGGYHEYALPDLIDLKNSSSARMTQRLGAARNIARWYYGQQEYEKAYQEMQEMHQLKPLNAPSADRTIVEIKLLQKMGQQKLARKKIWDLMESGDLRSDAFMSMAHLAEDENGRINWFNLLYEKFGYQQLEKIDTSKPLDLENVQSVRNSIDENLKKYKVSVIIPAYNAGDIIHVALDSLLNQSVQNLEIIVVDDCSPDHTTEVVAAYAERDPRIRLIKQDKNAGAYEARNKGLLHATGDFVTIHDIDDWSHPQKIEVQLKELVYNPNAVGSLTFLFRAAKDLSPINAGYLLSMRFVMLNSSSLLVRKSVIEAVGGWDSVRVAGDSEFIWRIEKLYGKESVIRVEPEVPFSISLASEGSLTAATTTHVGTIMFGLRRSYREAFEWWHSQAESAEELYMDPGKTNRHFPCPVPSRVIKPESRHYDYVLIADFSSDFDVEYLKEMLEYSTANGERTAVFYWPHYEKDAANRIADDIYSIIHQANVDLLVPNETVEADKVAVLTPEILSYALRSVPFVQSKQSYIVSDQENIPESRMIKEQVLKEALNLNAEWCTRQEFKTK